VWTPQGQKPLETTPGGNGKNFAFYTRLQVKRAEWIEVGKYPNATKVGQVIRTQAIKHKGGPPQRVATMDFFFTDATVDGVDFSRGDYDVAKDVLTAAVLMGTMRKNGGWYTFEDQKWNGIKDVLKSVRADDELRDIIEKRTREAVDNPHDKRTWTEADVESAATAKTTVRRRRKRAEDTED
jgi:recombination protein RecA